MRHFLFKTIAITALMLFPAASSVQAGGKVTFQSLIFNNMGMGGRMIRISDNGIFLDDAGMHFEGLLKMKVTGLRGERLICIVAPVDKDDNVMEDRQGELSNLTAFRVTSDNFTKTLPVEIPYTWINMERKEMSFRFDVTIVNSKMEEVGKQIIQVAPQDITVDRANMANKMAGDMLGFGGGDGGGLDVGGLLGGLFGGSDATSEHLCSACDGTGLCAQCYGDAFFDPSKCRRCAQDPGICRRCKGAKTETVEIDFNR